MGHITSLNTRRIHPNANWTSLSGSLKTVFYTIARVLSQHVSWIMSSVKKACVDFCCSYEITGIPELGSQDPSWCEPCPFLLPLPFHIPVISLYVAWLPSYLCACQYSSSRLLSSWLLCILQDSETSFLGFSVFSLCSPSPLPSQPLAVHYGGLFQHHPCPSASGLPSAQAKHTPKSSPSSHQWVLTVRGQGYAQEQWVLRACGRLRTPVTVYPLHFSTHSCSILNSL